MSVHGILMRVLYYIGIRILYYYYGYCIRYADTMKEKKKKRTTAHRKQSPRRRVFHRGIHAVPRKDKRHRAEVFGGDKTQKKNKNTYVNNVQKILMYTG